MEITLEQIIAYFKVQVEGKYNMLTPAARIATGLTVDEYNKIQDNYNLIYEQFSDLYESIERSELTKIINKPRYLLDSEKAALKFYSGYLFAMGELKIPINDVTKEHLKLLKLRLEILIDS